MECNFVNTKTTLIGFTCHGATTDYSSGNILAVACVRATAKWKLLWRANWHHRALADVNWEQTSPSNDVTDGLVLGRARWKTTWIAMRYVVAVVEHKVPQKTVKVPILSDFLFWNRRRENCGSPNKRDQRHFFVYIWHMFILRCPVCIVFSSLVCIVVNFLVCIVVSCLMCIVVSCLMCIVVSCLVCIVVSCVHCC